jgi:hypothetical protein
MWSARCLWARELRAFSDVRGAMKMFSDEVDVSPEPLAAVMVCSHGDCASWAPTTLEALRPLVARSSRAVLIRTGCLHPHGPCPATPECACVRLQLCTDDLRRPLGPGVAVAGTTRATYRKVEAWLDQAPPPSGGCAR